MHILCCVLTLHNTVFPQFNFLLLLNIFPLIIAIQMLCGFYAILGGCFLAQVKIVHTKVYDIMVSRNGLCPFVPSMEYCMF